MKHAIILAMATMLMAGCVGETPQKPIEPQQTPTESMPNEAILIPLSDLSQSVKKYSFSSDGTEIRYMAVLGSDGEPRVAFDGCNACGGELGYSQSGGDVVCNRCGQHFKIDSLGPRAGGGCFPVYLPHEVVDGNILIKKSDITVEKALFQQ